MKHLFNIIFLVLIASSCEKTLDLNIGTDDKRLLVNGEFTNDSTIHCIELSRAGSLLTDQPQIPISGAHVYITDLVDTIHFVENIDSPGLYQTIKKCFGTVGHTYYLSITNIDVDDNGISDSYSATCKMPVPVEINSMSSLRGIHPSDRIPGINNMVSYTIEFNGPDYIYDYMQVNNQSVRSLSDRLGTGEIDRFEDQYKSPKVQHPDSSIVTQNYFFISEGYNPVISGDTLVFIGLNINQKHFEFLKAFDNTTNTGDIFQDNLWDQLTIPSNVPTNIEPSDRAAGYFQVYSVSKYSKVFTD